MPVSVKVWRLPSVEMTICSPTLKRSRAAVWRSMTTCRVPCAQVPEASLSSPNAPPLVETRCGLEGSVPRAKLMPVALRPSRPTMSATFVSPSGETSAAASATPGRPRTVSSNAAGIVAWLPVVEPLTISFSKIAASVDVVDSAASE